MELSRVEHILKYFLGEEATLPQPLSRVEELLIALGELIEEGKVTNPISIRGRVNTVNDLPSDAEPGWLYFVGLATDTEFTEYIYLDSGRWEYLGTSMISIDTTLSTTSTNPVQNSTITTELNKKPGEITTGKQYTIDGQTVTAGTGAEVFNNSENNKASGMFSHAEGVNTTAFGFGSHAEGASTKSSGAQSHSEGSNTTASNSCSHAEGQATTASGAHSHAEGAGTIASGGQSHAEGSNATASGAHSHAEGSGTKASSDNQHAQGKYNVEDANDTYAFIIGNGTADNARHNAFAIDWNGLIYVNGAATGVDVSALPTSADFPSMTQDEYDELTPAQKSAHLYYFIHEDDEEESGS